MNNASDRRLSILLTLASAAWLLVLIYLLWFVASLL